MKIRTERMMKGIAPLIVLMTLFAWSCDQFEDDVVPDGDDATLGQTDFYTLPNLSAVIDLKPLVKSYTQVSLTITGQPFHGDLNKIADGVFTYTPDENFKGKDYFMIDVKSNGNSVLKDSVTITISQDTTAFPCGLYAVHDSVTILYTAFPHFGVTIPVLDNDRICGTDKTDVIVSLFSAPSNGEAGVVETLPMEIRYVANTGFSGDDHFVYKISNSSDTSVYSLALVTVSVTGGPCISTLNNDSTLFQKVHVMQSVNVFENDDICDLDPVNDVFSIVTAPKYGTAMLEGMGIIHYVPDPLANYKPDSLRYRYCHNDVCSTATLYINYWTRPCESIVSADSVELPLSASSLQVMIAVLDNDIICDGVKSLTIGDGPNTGSAIIEGHTIYYIADSQTSPSDSLTYNVCNMFDVCGTGRVFIRRQ